MNLFIVCVMCDGEENVILVSNFVVGDIVFLEDGVMVLVDFCLIEILSLKI